MTTDLGFFGLAVGHPALLRHVLATDLSRSARAVLGL
jgi:hypothetical protein